MANFDDEWSRRDAVEQIELLLDSAKTGHAQKIVDLDGVFEVRFLKPKNGTSVADFLAEGLPWRKDSKR